MNKNKIKGFTLIEVIVSIAILSTLLIAGLYMMSSSITAISKEGNNTKSLYLAQDIMEQLTSGKDVSPSIEYSKLDWNNPSVTPIESKTMQGIGTVAGKTYTISEKSSGKVILTVFKSE